MSTETNQSTASSLAAREKQWLSILAPWGADRQPLRILEIGPDTECATLPDASFDLVCLSGATAAGVLMNSLVAARLAKPGGMILWENADTTGIQIAARTLGISVQRRTKRVWSFHMPEGLKPFSPPPAGAGMRLARRAKRNLIDKPRRKLAGLFKREQPAAFSKNWFKMHEENWNRFLLPLRKKNQPVQILEVGSYDGQSACWFIKNFLTHPQSRLTCCDLWEQQSGDKVYEEKMDDVYERFQRNCRATGKWDQLRIFRGDSKISLQALAGDRFDLIYVDGDHSAPGVYADTLLACPLLAPGGLILWDDYNWCASVKEGVDRACAELGITLQAFGNNVCHQKPLAPARPTKIVGLVPARNEEARIGFCLRALSQFTDAIVYLDDCSTDGTLRRVEEVAQECRVERILRNAEWRRQEPADRNRLLQAGREIGGTHFVVLDADEAFTANCRDEQMLRRLISSLQPGEQLAMTWIQLWRSLDFYREDASVWTNNLKSIAFCDDGICAYESEFIHTPRVPSNLRGARVTLPGYQFGLLHFQFVNWQNLLLKQAWYRCLERVRDPKKPARAINDLYAPSKDEFALELRPAPARWLAYPFFDKAAVDAPDLWRKAQIESWFKEHGTQFFAELDIWELPWAAAGKTAGADAPRVSVLVSTFKGERFLRGCLEDLEAQTIAPQLEIIVIDSGSPENEEAIAREFQQRHKNIIYVRTERETLYGAWNRALALARAPYITNANTDDRHAPEALEKMASLLDRQPSADVVYANCAVTKTPNAQFGAAPVHGWFRWPRFDRRLLFSVCFIGPQPMWRRSLHDRFGLFDAQMTCAGDYDFWLRISGQARFVHLPETLGLYLEHPAGIEKSGPQIARQESEKARRRNWPKELGRAPKVGGNFFQPAGEIPEIPLAQCDNPPLVSVIVLARSQPQRLRETFQSVLGQSLRDFEIIAVYNGETPPFECPSANFRWIHESNCHRSAMRNTALGAARGGHIAHLEEGDVLYQHHLRNLIDILRVTGKKAAYSDADGIPAANTSHQDWLLRKNVLPLACLLHEKACLQATGGFDLQLTACEGWDFCIRLSRHFDFVHLKKTTCEIGSVEEGKDAGRQSKLISKRYQIFATAAS